MKTLMFTVVIALAILTSVMITQQVNAASKDNAQACDGGIQTTKGEFHSCYASENNPSNFDFPCGENNAREFGKFNNDRDESGC